ncbi:AICDA [Lepeophtheirus salmonis]|uniref:AICDA n=1 Tax=Lepeophtheirus salmonis TaxID=72036 RepID=A0A7R8CP35_LEPSM|nr:AICDA [Lepeophtheirus salmonis]CAF2846557.1 AICDA [Lepeophtheirus salmonis]
MQAAEKHRDLTKIEKISNSDLNNSQLKKRKSFQLFREAGLFYRIKLELDPIQDGCDVLVKKERRTRTEIYRFSRHLENSLSILNEYVCQQITKYYTKLYSCLDCGEESICVTCKSTEQYFCEDLRTEPEDIKVTDVQNNSLERHISEGEIKML